MKVSAAIRFDILPIKKDIAIVHSTKCLVISGIMQADNKKIELMNFDLP